MTPYLRSLSLVLAAFVAFSGQSTQSAYVIPVKGMAPMGVQPPTFPVNAQQCQAFAEKAMDYQKQLARWHDDCLKANKGASAAKGAQCTAPACERYHVARDSFSKQASTEATACYTAVSSQRDEMYRSIGTREELNLAQSALAKGPYAAVTEWLRRKLGDTFKSASKADSASSAALLAKDVWAPMAAARATCISKVPSSAAMACEKQVVLSISDLSATGVDSSQANPAIRLWQQAMLERLGIENHDALRQLETSFSDEGDSDEGGTIGR